MDFWSKIMTIYIQARGPTIIWLAPPPPPLLFKAVNPFPKIDFLLVLKKVFDASSLKVRAKMVSLFGRTLKQRINNIINAGYFDLLNPFSVPPCPATLLPQVIYYQF